MGGGFFPKKGQAQVFALARGQAGGPRLRGGDAGRAAHDGADAHGAAQGKRGVASERAVGRRAGGMGSLVRGLQMAVVVTTFLGSHFGR